MIGEGNAVAHEIEAAAASIPNQAVDTGVAADA